MIKKKVKSLSICFILIISGNWNFGNILSSQSFINPGAEWMFWSNVDGGGYTAYRRWKYTEDITIDTLSYQKISVTSRSSIPYSPDFPDNSGGYTQLVTQTPFLFRCSGDSLFIAGIDGSNERLLYDFTPVIGNTWDASPFINLDIVEPTSPLIIETIAFGDTIINGQTVDWVEVVSSNPDSLIFNGRIFKHFGKQQVFPFWNDGITLHHNPLTWECYSDDILGTIGFSPCIDIETLSINEIDENSISITPNFLAKNIAIGTKNRATLEIISVSNVSGKVLKFSTNLNSDTFDFNEPTGIYFITIKFQELIYTEKFFWSSN
jgi:hypothetical protein